MKWEAKPTLVPLPCQACRAVTSLDGGSLGRELAGQFARLEDAALGDDGGGRDGLSSAARDLSRPKPLAVREKAGGRLFPPSN